MEQDDIEIVVTDVGNPASFLQETPTELLAHDSLATTETVYSSRPDLKEEHLEGSDSWFTNGTQVVEAKPLPANMSAQKAEIITLTRALELAKDKWINIRTDSIYALGIVHVHGAFRKEQGLLTIQGK